MGIPANAEKVRKRWPVWRLAAPLLVCIGLCILGCSSEESGTSEAKKGDAEPTASTTTAARKPDAAAPLKEHAGHVSTPTTAAALKHGEVVLLKDDFEDGNADGWTPFDGRWQVENGIYAQKQAPIPHHDYYTACGDLNWSDYTFSVRTRTLSNESLCIMGRQQNGTGYMVSQSDASAALEFRAGRSRWTRLGQVEHAPVKRSDWHELALQFKGDTIRYYLDGKLLIEVRDSRQPKGNIALMTTKPAEHDDVLVTRE